MDLISDSQNSICRVLDIVIKEEVGILGFIDVRKVLVANHDVMKWFHRASHVDRFILNIFDTKYL